MVRVFAWTVALSVVFKLMISEHAYTSENPSPRRMSAHELGDLNRCGPLSLQTCAIFLGRDISGQDINRLLPPTGEEYSLFQIQNAAESLGLCTFALEWGSEFPPGVSLPAIIPIMQKSGRVHFVALMGRSGNQSCVVDVPHAPHWRTEEELREDLHWNGFALHIAEDAKTLTALRKRTELKMVVRVAGVFCLGLFTVLAANKMWNQARLKHRLRQKDPDGS